MAPVPPSTRRAEVNASTGAVLRRIMLTAVFSTGPLRARAHAFAVNDAHATQVVRERAGQEFAQRRLGFVDPQAVQVADFFDAVFAALQFAQDAVLHAGAAEGDFVTRVGDFSFAQTPAGFPPAPGRDRRR